MRKILFVMFAALAFVACEKDFQPTTEMVDLENVVQSNKVSLNQALVYAENSINGIGTSTRSTSRKVKSSEIFVAKPSTRNVESEEVSFYLINYENNEGYAMVSTDSRTTPVYAYSDEGNLTPEDFENNPGLKIFLEGAILNYEDEIANCSTYALGDGDRLPIFEIPEELMAINDMVEIVEVNRVYYFKGTRVNENIKGPFVSVAWHQDFPYNQHFENYYAGCGPVAVGQVMSYHKYPASYNNNTYNYHYTYDWDYITAIPTHNINHMNDVALIISDLLEIIAKIADFDYGNNAAILTSKSGLMNALQAFGYQCQGYNSFDSSLVFANINNNNPVIIGGENQDEEYGHFWVIDGYSEVRTITTLYNITYPYNEYSATSTDPTKYYHCNWGFNVGFNANAKHNGYYLYNSFGYTSNMEMIYNIHP